MGAKKKAAPKKAASARGRKPAGAMVMPTALKSELSEYEKIREGNIKEREAMLRALMDDMDSFKKDSGIGQTKKAPVKKRKRVEYDSDGEEIEGSFTSKVRVEGSRKSTRLSLQPEDKGKMGSEVTYSEKDACRLAEEHSDYDEDDYQAYEDRHKKRAPRPGQIDPNDNVLTPEDVTAAMIKNICARFGDKKYSQTIGTSCHQCRQKTTDTKTICRSGKCVGVRGQFCGRCLEIRYGEDAEEALMNASWSCPPCRGFCNCSICRNRNGKGATGILIQLAQSKGYDNVASYLKHLQGKHKSDEFDHTDDEMEDDHDGEEGLDGEKKPKKGKKKKGKKGKKSKAKKEKVKEDEAETKDEEENEETEGGKEVEGEPEAEDVKEDVKEVNVEEAKDRMVEETEDVSVVEKEVETEKIAEIGLEGIKNEVTLSKKLKEGDENKAEELVQEDAENEVHSSKKVEKTRELRTRKGGKKAEAVGELDDETEDKENDKNEANSSKKAKMPKEVKTPKTPKTPLSSKKDKSGKIQGKISSFFSPPAAKKTKDQDEKEN